MKKAQQQIVSFSGVLEVVHALPGRMRLRMPSLRARARALAEFATSLKRLEGIQDVMVNPVLGTALVRYDAAKLTPSLVVAAAVGIMIVLSSATVYHLVRSEFSSALITLVMFVMASYLAYGRWRVLPIRPRHLA